MRHGSLNLGLVGLALAAALIAAPAHAQFDLTGPWQVNISSTNYPFDFTQTGTMLQVNANGEAWVGTIDTGTGVFSIHPTDAVIAMTLQCAVIDATLAPTNDSFTGTYASAPLQCTGLPHFPVCQCGTFTTPTPVTGTRDIGTCGDGTVDAGEQCDDGNVQGGDCCSPICTYASAGASCADAEACTYDTCDGAGVCTHGPYPGCRTPSKGAALSLRDDGTGNAQVKWGWKDDSGSTSLGDLGLPTGTTAYRLCLFTGNTLLFGGEVPAGSAWHAKSNGFAYKSVGSAPDGIGTLTLRAGETKTTLLAKGKGPLVVFTGPLDVPSVHAQLVRDAGTRCWEGTFDSPKKSTPTRFLARE